MRVDGEAIQYFPKLIAKLLRRKIQHIGRGAQPLVSR